MRKPRVLWLGVDGGDELFRLQKAIDRNLSKLGFPREKKRFHPHLTVGRVKLLAPRSELPERFGSFVFNAIEWKAEEVRVLKSELRSSGAVYSVLEITRL